MKILTSYLKQIPEFERLVAAMDSGRCPVAVSGLSAVHRAFFAAGLRALQGRPVVLVCSDEHEAERLGADVRALTGEDYRLLPARELTFYEAATASHQWEHRRLSVLRAMVDDMAPVVVTTVDALLQRTMPPAMLAQASQLLRVGGVYDLNELANTLAAAGYARCEQVEGVGQFALRGGILDFFSPSHEKPVRCEFFGDEVDSMGFFDPTTQRRVMNISEAEILPAAEVLPQFAPGGVAGLTEALERLISSEKKHPALVEKLEKDRERIHQGLSFPAMDRYLALIYPEMATAADYLPPDAVVLFSESSRVAERGKNYLWQLNEDAAVMVENGVVAGKLATFARTMEELMARLQDWPVAYLDSFSVSAYPEAPKALLSLLIKQTPSFGASLETAVSDPKLYAAGG